MLSSIQIIDVLKNWNIWGGVNLAQDTVPRLSLTEISRFFPDRQILALIGIRRYEIFYFQKKQEVDFYARHENGDALLINVTWEMAGRTTRQRELAGLQEAMSELGVKNGLLLTERREEEIKVPEGDIAVRPLWLWALESGFSYD